MVVDTIKSFSNNVGTHIKDAYKTTGTELHHFSRTVKDTITFHHRDYDKDDELISDYKHDLKQARKGLKHLISQNNQLYKRLLPGVLAMNLKVAKDFINLIGPNSLHFKNIERYYHDFDVYQATQIIPHVHPKEREFLIESVNEELYQYTRSIEGLKVHLDEENEYFAHSLNPKIKNMRKRLNETLKLIKHRDRARQDQDILNRKIAKMNQKQPPLSEKDQKHIEEYLKEFEVIDTKYNALNDKAVAILPHIMSFLQEFLENIIKLLICHQTTVYEKTMETLKYFNIFYGYMNEETIPDYETITTQWEQDITRTRLQLESFLQVVQGKHTDINEDIDDKDKASKTHKFWVSMTNRLQEKKHVVKPKNQTSGMFNDTVAIDPLDAFVKYENPQANQTETYHPRKVIAIEDVVVLKKEVTPPPPLPPRRMSALPILIQTQTHYQSQSQSQNQNQDQAYNQSSLPVYPSALNESMESLNLDDDYDDDGASSIISDSSDVSSISSASFSRVTTRTSSDKQSSTERHLSKIYNTAKNEIKVAPLALSPSLSAEKNVLSWDFPVTVQNSSERPPMTRAYELSLWQKFFDKLDKSASTERVAKYDFDGRHVGDLSFKQGDTIEIIFDFQRVDSLYSQDNHNWLIGIIRGDDSANTLSCRIGLVPSNYLV
ncbi:hypothetical protein PVL30_003325 [Lodderomyces elongisporus]|uniref:uncharacterized protein n=1 Tax=Lodderomyces elongisporus TaxID=36914 RepID=UPI00291DB1D3|nr:uncharacterized protein PVL30_003325 [Lodderomyces elongisporus]WLF79570.1 hypothetical protein PVL30_003325 [Lodderomyces elongisporus]